MKKRIITGIILLAVFIPVLWFSDTVVFTIALAVICAVSVYEMTKCIGIKKAAVTAPSYVFAVAAPFLVRYMNIKTVAMIAFICFSAYMLYLFTAAVTSHGRLAFADISTLYVLSLYIITACASIIYIRDFGENGKYIFLLIFIGAWITDTFAYFTGVFFGKHKLIPDVSPKKTIEGSIGGTVFCAVFYVVFGIVVDRISDSANANLLLLAIAGLVIAVISQIGDLIMSVIKRHYGVKDYGKIFPGHGGMLDRFDSILAVSLGIAMLCTFVSLFGLNIL